MDSHLVYQYPDIFEKDITSRKDGDWLRVAIAKPRKPKTNKQLGYYYAVVLPVIHSAMLDKGWEIEDVPVCIEQADHYLKAKCGNKKNKESMSLEEASAFIANCIKHGDIYFGCSIPLPQEMEKS
tara:strand:- start:10290 stop:10664 length:375 start_codon:yes stop_codon:yes gene_type:complete